MMIEPSRRSGVAMSTPQFGRYQLLRSLAAGGMAEVFLARVEGVAGFSKLVALAEKRISGQRLRNRARVAGIFTPAKSPGMPTRTVCAVGRPPLSCAI